MLQFQLMTNSNCIAYLKQNLESCHLSLHRLSDCRRAGEKRSYRTLQPRARPKTAALLPQGFFPTVDRVGTRTHRPCALAQSNAGGHARGRKQAQAPVLAVERNTWALTQELTFLLPL